MRYVDYPRGAFSVHVSAKALSGASIETRISRVRRSFFARNSGTLIYNGSSKKGLDAMKLKKGNKEQDACFLNRLFETGKSQVSLFQSCENDSPILLVRFAVSIIRQCSGNSLKVGELHIISKRKLTREAVKSVVELFRNQVDYLFYFDPTRGWEQFDSDSHSQSLDFLVHNSRE